ncbi:hypothetical protein EMCRGX_G007846 [Ephydatia muelleri]
MTASLFCQRVCVSPLVSLMMDQVSKYSSKGLTTQFLGEDRKTILSSVECWKVNIMQLVFISPEALLRNKQWKQMLSTSPYRENLVALVVDEAHCVETWGDSFRPEFSRIGDIRSIKPSDVRIMALTATATNTTRKVVISRLCMEDPVIVYVPPTKTNITYSVIEKPSINVVVQQIAKELLEYGDKSCRTIIYCRKHLEVASMYEEFVKVLGESFTFPIGKPYLVMYRLVDMYTKCTENCIKEKIVSAFANPDSTLRVIIATTAFGMGIIALMCTMYYIGDQQKT